MAKLPYDQFYYANFQSDTQTLSVAAKGALIRLLCLGWDAPERGKTVKSIDVLARVFGCCVDDARTLLDEIARERIGDISVDGDIYTVICRRQVRDEAKRSSGAVRQQIFRGKRSRNAPSDGDVTRMSRDSNAACNAEVTPKRIEDKDINLPPTPQEGDGGGDESVKITDENWDTFAKKFSVDLTVRQARKLTEVSTGVNPIAIFGHLIDIAGEGGIHSPGKLAAHRARDGDPTRENMVLVRAWLFPPPEPWRCHCGGDLKNDGNDGYGRGWFLCESCGKRYPDK